MVIESVILEIIFMQYVSYIFLRPKDSVEIVFRIIRRSRFINLAILFSD